MRRVNTIVVPPDVPVLVLEDNDQRMKWFRRRVPWLTHATRPYEVQEALRRIDEFSVLFLDHDLGETVGWAPNAPNGVDAADIIFSLKRDTTQDIIIHSINAGGAARMNKILPAARQIPFGAFEIQVMGRA